MTLEIGMNGEDMFHDVLGGPFLVCAFRSGTCVGFHCAASG
jgi:hypothetical protein